MVIKQYLLVMILLSLSVYLNPVSTHSSYQEGRLVESYQIPLSIQSKLTLGYSNVIALIKWFKFMSYFGGTNHHELNSLFLLQQLKEITSLNPNHKPAYSIAATVLPWLMGTAKPSQSLLDKALYQFPLDWHWPFYMGFNVYWFDHDRKKSAAYLTQAASLKNAPPIVMQLALRMQTDTGQFTTALMFIDRQIKTATDSTIQRQLIKQRIAILTEKNLHEIESLLAKLPPHEHNQQGIQKLIQNGYHIPKILPDGGHILFEKDGSLISSKSRKRFKLFIPPKRQGVIQK